MAARKPDHFLADAVGTRRPVTLSYRDGFRFGIGFMVAMLLIWTILGGLCWAAVALMRFI